MRFVVFPTKNGSDSGGSVYESSVIAANSELALRGTRYEAVYFHWTGDRATCSGCRRRGDPPVAANELEQFYI